MHLSRLRQKKNLTQQKLAEKAGISVWTVRAIESRGHRNLTADTLRKLARALRVPVSELC